MPLARDLNAGPIAGPDFNGGHILEDYNIAQNPPQLSSSRNNLRFENQLIREQS